MRRRTAAATEQTLALLPAAKWVSIGVGALVFVNFLIGAVAAFRNTHHSANAVIALIPRPDSGTATIFEGDLEALVKSPRVLDPVVADLNLAETYARKFNRSELSIPEVREHLAKQLLLNPVPKTTSYYLIAVSDSPDSALRIITALAERLVAVTSSEVRLPGNRVVELARPPAVLPNHRVSNVLLRLGVGIVLGSGVGLLTCWLLLQFVKLALWLSGRPTREQISEKPQSHIPGIPLFLFALVWAYAGTLVLGAVDSFLGWHLLGRWLAFVWVLLAGGSLALGWMLNQTLSDKAKQRANRISAGVGFATALVMVGFAAWLLMAFTQERGGWNPGLPEFSQVLLILLGAVLLPLSYARLTRGPVRIGGLAFIGFSVVVAGGIAAFAMARNQRVAESNRDQAESVIHQKQASAAHWTDYRRLDQTMSPGSMGTASFGNDDFNCDILFNETSFAVTLKYRKAQKSEYRVQIEERGGQRIAFDQGGVIRVIRTTKDFDIVEEKKVIAGRNFGRIAAFVLQRKTDRAAMGERGFTPVQDRTVEVAMPPLWSWFDVDIGQSVPTAQSHDPDLDAAHYVGWTNHPDADFRAVEDGNRRGLDPGASGCLLVPISPSHWTTLTAEQLPALLEPPTNQAPAPFLFSPRELPATFGFKTRAGNAGLLQITKFTEGPMGVKIRYKLVQNDRSVRPPAAPIIPTDLSFGPVLDRFMPMDAEGLTDLLDLDTGKIIAAPKQPAIRQGLALLSTPGLAIRRDEQKGETTLLGMNGVIPQESQSDQWDVISNLQALDTLRNNVSSEGVMVGTSAPGNPPHTFLFKTATGRVGILQITGFTENPRGVKIRYKLVQDYRPAAIGQSALNSSWQDVKTVRGSVHSNEFGGFDLVLENFPRVTTETDWRVVAIDADGRAHEGARMIATSGYGVGRGMFRYGGTNGNLRENAVREFRLQKHSHGADDFREYTVNKTFAELARTTNPTTPESVQAAAAIGIMEGDPATILRRYTLDLMTFPAGSVNLTQSEKGKADTREALVRRTIIYRDELAVVIFEQLGEFVSVVHGRRDGQWKIFTGADLPYTATELEAVANFKARAAEFHALLQKVPAQPPSFVAEAGKEAAANVGEMMGAMINTLGQAVGETNIAKMVRGVLTNAVSQLTAPSSSTSHQSGSKIVPLVITADGALTAAGQRYDSLEPSVWLGPLSVLHPTAVTISADAAVPFSQVTKIMAACQSAGIKVESFRAEPQTHSPASALSQEAPQLRFLAWEDEWKTNAPFAAWHPDGSAVTNEMELAWLREVSHVVGSSISSNTLLLWFSQPLFDRQSYANVTLSDASGAHLPIVNGRLTTGRQEAQANIGNFGWVTFSMNRGPGLSYPPMVNLKLRYTIGPWDQERSVRVEATLQDDADIVETGVKVRSIGQNARGGAFLALAFGMNYTGNRQLGVTAVGKDGRDLWTAGSSMGGQFDEQQQQSVEQFHFPVPLADIISFRIGSRPIRTSEWRNVVLTP